jgi:secreted trypsin-like serine protease
MKAFIALSLLVAVAVASPHHKGRLQDRIVLFPHLMAKDGALNPSGRIVGGEEATAHEFPAIVALSIDNAYFCGGNIISENTILTAAHCADGARSIEVTAGAHAQNLPESTQQVVSMGDAGHMEHEGWNRFTLANDLALVYLETPLKMNSNVAAIDLAASEPSVGASVTMAGWGKTCDGAIGCGVSSKLNKVTCPVLNDDDAEAIYGNMSWDTIICIDTSGGKGTCNGDSGGPLMNAAGDLTGLTSFGAAAGCEKGYPACFTSVPEYRSWINLNMQ